MTLLEQKKQKHAIYAERKSAGICITCGVTSVGLNQNGQKSLRCPECKAAFMASRVNTHRNETSKAQITAYRAPRIRLSSDEIDERHETRCQIAAVKVLPFIRESQTVTVGAITREYPEFQDCILSVLKMLKIIGEVNYDEHSASPVRVTATAMKRVQVKHRGYNNSDIIAPAADKTRPAPQSLYGPEHARIL